MVRWGDCLLREFTNEVKRSHKRNFDETRQFSFIPDGIPDTEPENAPTQTKNQGSFWYCFTVEWAYACWDLSRRRVRLPVSPTTKRNQKRAGCKARSSSPPGPQRNHTYISERLDLRPNSLMLNSSENRMASWKARNLVQSVLHSSLFT